MFFSRLFIKKLYFASPAMWIWVLSACLIAYYIENISVLFDHLMFLVVVYFIGILIIAFLGVEVKTQPRIVNKTLVVPITKDVIEIENEVEQTAKRYGFVINISWVSNGTIEFNIDIPDTRIIKVLSSIEGSLIL